MLMMEQLYPLAKAFLTKIGSCILREIRSNWDLRVTHRATFGISFWNYGSDSGFFIWFGYGSAKAGP